MNRKMEYSTDDDGPCWSAYPSLLTIAQAAQIMQANNIRRASDWLIGANLITQLPGQGRRVSKADLRRRLENSEADGRNERSRWN